MVLILVWFDSEPLCFRLKLKAVPVLINLFKRYRAGYVMSPSANIQRETSKKTSSDTCKQVARPSRNFGTIGTGTKYHRHFLLAPITGSTLRNVDYRANIDTRRDEFSILISTFRSYTVGIAFVDLQLFAIL